MANTANILLHVRLESDDFIKIEQIDLELKELSYDFYEVLYADEGVLEISMGGAWVAPIDEFQEICNTYGCEILGVATEFGNFYVDAFDLHSEISPEDTTDRFIKIESNEQN